MFICTVLFLLDCCLGRILNWTVWHNSRIFTIEGNHSTVEYNDTVVEKDHGVEKMVPLRPGRLPATAVHNVVFITRPNASLMKNVAENVLRLACDKRIKEEYVINYYFNQNIIILLIMLIQVKSNKADQRKSFTSSSFHEGHFCVKRS